MYELDNYSLRIKSVINRYALMAFKDPNVIGVGRGLKIKNGTITKYPTLTIIVKRKIYYDSLNPVLRIPKIINGVVTDILDERDFQSNKVCNNKFINTFDKVSALGGGCLTYSGSNPEINFGTMGYAVTDKKSRANIYFLASGNFLSENDGTFKKGKQIYYSQGRSVESLRSRWVLGKIENVIPIRIFNEPNPDPALLNRTNAGICLVGPNNDKTKELILPGLINNKIVIGVANGSLQQYKVGDEVYKVGAATGYTEGRILAVDGVTKLEDKNGKINIYMKDQVFTTMSKEVGDLGALGVMKNNGKAFGMLNGGAKGMAIFSDISVVFQDLKIELLF